MVQVEDGQENGSESQPEILDATSYIEKGQLFLSKESYFEAAEAFSHAVETLTEKHGELSPETVDALIYYGKALLRHAVASSGVFGGPTSAPANGEASSSKQPIPAQVPVIEASSSTSAPRGAFHFGGDAEEDEDEERADDAADESGAGDGQDPSSDDLENAYEILDMARTILIKMPESTETKQKLARVHEALGEVSTESEKFSEAAEEYLSALNILKTLLPEHDRTLAEAHLMVALSYEFIPQTSAEITSQVGTDARTKAVEHAEAAKHVLNLRKAFLIAEENKKGHNDEAAYDAAAQKELVDIAEISEELDLKIEDLKALPEIAELTEKDKKADAFLNGASLPADAPVNDLGSMGLVKKKKPAASAAPGSSNGHTEPSNGVTTIGFGLTPHASEISSTQTTPAVTSILVKRKAESGEEQAVKKVKFSE